ncbi:MAG: hypothetical protein HY696_10775 [Deltaproteobacteria bacterium]|nr:hypothetical protein [Deltaproteobacteria bacterium]
MGQCTVSVRSSGIKKIAAILLGVLLLTASGEVNAGIEAGFIDTGAGRVLLIDEPERGVQAAFGFSLESIRFQGSGAALPGQIYVVSPSGRWRVAAMAVADRQGMRVSLPAGQGSKLVYTNRQGSIVGGVGWSAAEVQRFAALHDLHDLMPFAALAKPELQPGFYESIALSAISVADATAVSAGERAMIFLSAVEMLGGNAARNLVDAILQTADSDNTESLAGFAELFFGDAPQLVGEPIVGGVHLLSGDLVGMGDNGGVGPTKGSVAMGDNGGVGPTKGSVAMGDNGGVGPTKGSVAMGDNGGVGPTKGLVDPSVLVAGSAAGLSVPLPPAPIGLSADCSGNFIFLLGQ